MVRLDVVLSSVDSLTPELAARLTRVDEHCAANLQMEYRGVRVRLDSLIGILSVPCHRGEKLTVIADGQDEQDAAQAVRAVLEN